MPQNIKPIETIEEFEEAKERIKTLDVSTSTPSSSEVDEMKALRMAVEKWKHYHAEMPAIKPRRD